MNFNTIITRPDISKTMSKLSEFLQNPSLIHLAAANRTLEYLVRTKFLAIEFDKNVASNIGWSALFKTPGNRRRMRIICALAFFSQWSGNGLVYVIHTFYQHHLHGLIAYTGHTVRRS